MRVTRLLLVPLVGWTLLGCHKMGRVTSDPASYILVNRPPRVSLTLRDGAHVDLAGPQIVADTLTGFLKGKYFETPLASITGMRALQPAPAQTIAAILAVGTAVVSGAVYAYTHAGSAIHSECFSIEDDITTC